MMRKPYTLILALGALALSFNSFAASPPSCAAIAKIAESPTDRLLTVVIDKTTVIDDNLASKFTRIATDALQHSTEVNIYTFSAFSQGEYFTQIYDAKVEAPISSKDRYTQPKKALRVYDNCLGQQKPALSYQVDSKINQAISEASSVFAQSDIMYTLTRVAKDMKNNSATEKHLLLLSDMLENSSISSFYYRNNVRHIDVEKELILAEKAGMFADFSGAKVYVMGGGIISETGHKSGVYRDPKTLQALHLFWKEWFKRSNAELIELGMPEMTQSIH